jgi:hypothetical protein
MNDVEWRLRACCRSEEAVLLRRGNRLVLLVAAVSPRLASCHSEPLAHRAMHGVAQRIESHAQPPSYISHNFFKVFL